MWTPLSSQTQTHTHTKTKSPAGHHLPAGLAGDFSCSGRGVAGEPATRSGSGSSTGAGGGAGTSLGGGDAEGMVAGRSSSSSSSEEDSDDEEEEEDDEDDDEEDEELDELLLSESDVLSFSPSESAYREHLEDESLSPSSPGNPEGAIRRGGNTPHLVKPWVRSLPRSYGQVRLCARGWEVQPSRSWISTLFVHSETNFSLKDQGSVAKGSPGFCLEDAVRGQLPGRGTLKSRRTSRSTVGRYEG